MRRAPAWFTQGKTRERIQTWWPWALGAFAATLYYLNPKPIEEVRVAALSSFRKPFLKASEWIEVRDLDPETLALELPPQQLFGPLPLEQQMKFVLHALRTDNDLADDYVTRLVIDMMDMSLDPPRSNLLVKSGGVELLQFAIDDFTDKRPNRKRKFFGPDQFLRVLNMCASHYELANYFIEKCNGVHLVFKALKEAENEYARVLASRSLTLFALLQNRDGSVEKQIIDSGYLPRLIDTYRLSTGDPTDTRFQTLLLSSIMRSFPNEAVYNTLVSENVVSAVVQNMNLTRYKGMPQHLRVLHDLDEMRSRLHLVEPATITPQDVGVVGGIPRAAMPAARTRFQAFMAKRSEEQRRQQLLEESERTGAPLPADYEKNPYEIDDTLRLLPPANLHATVEQLAYDSDFLPVALGVCEVFCEYFEATTETLKWVERLLRTKTTTPYELLEYKGASVIARVVGRLEREDHFFVEGGPGDTCYNLVKTIFADEKCAPFTSPDNAAGNLETKTAMRNLREFVSRYELRKLGDVSTTPLRQRRDTLSSTSSLYRTTTTAPKSINPEIPSSITQAQSTTTAATASVSG